MVNILQAILTQRVLGDDYYEHTKKSLTQPSIETNKMVIKTICGSKKDDVIILY